jgi:cytochrome c biogenesis factor
MIRKILIVFMLLCQLSASGCAVVAIGVAGLGAGLGMYTYIDGELKRMYQANHEESIQAVNMALTELNISVKEQTPYEQGTTTVIKAERSDHTPVRVTVKSETVRVSEIGIRCGYVGVWDKQASEQIHSAIAQRLVR